MDSKSQEFESLLTDSFPTTFPKNLALNVTILKGTIFYMISKDH